MERQGRIHKKSVIDGTDAGDILVWDGSDWTIAAHGDITGVDDGTAAGQMMFWTGTKWTYTETTELIWDDTNKRFGIGQATPTGSLHLSSGDMIIDSTIAIGLDMSGGTFATAVQNWPATPIIQAGGTQIIKFDDTNFNMFIGSDVFQNINEGTTNIGIGFHAGYQNDTSTGKGTNNVYIGYRSGAGIVATNKGADNVGIGAQTLERNTTGDANMALGGRCLAENTIGDNNIAIGKDCGRRITTAQSNTLIGSQSFQALTIGSGNNTAIGYLAGFYCTGSRNLFLGASAGALQTAISDRLILDNQDRGSIANEITNCLMYGIFDATVTNQSIRFNVGNLTLASGTPYQYLINDTHEDTDGGRESRIDFKGSQGVDPFEETTLARIEVSHDGTGADDKGKFVISVNDGDDDDAPTTRLTIDSLGINRLTIQGTATGNIAIGDSTTLDALDSTPTYNIAIGNGAGSGITDGDDNIFIGYRAGYQHTTGGHNIAIGYEAGYSGGIIGGMTAVGYQAMKYHGTGNGNTCIGYQAGHGDFGGAAYTYNTFIGEMSGVACNDGGSNVCLGKNSGKDLFDGDRNIYLGFDAGHTQTDNSDLLIIDNRERANVATDITNAILYGVMAAAPADQSLRINAEILGSDGAKIGDGGVTNYTEIETDGTIEFHGTATVWDDLVLPLDSARVPAANAPNWESFVGNLNAYAYEVDDFQEFTTELLHGYKEGSSFTFHIHGALNATTAQDEKVRFEVEYSIADTNTTTGIGDVFPDGSGALLIHELVVPNTTPDLSNIYITIGVDSAATFAVGATIKGRIRRIAKSVGGNELTGNIFVTQVGIHYEINTVGSRTELTK